MATANGSSGMQVKQPKLEKHPSSINSPYATPPYENIDEDEDDLEVSC